MSRRRISSLTGSHCSPCQRDIASSGRCAQLAGLELGSVLCEDMAINHFFFLFDKCPREGGRSAPVLSMPAHHEKVISNPSSVAAVTTSGRSYPPLSPGRLALCCSIIPLSVIKGSQGEQRWSGRGEELRIGVHFSH